MVIEDVRRTVRENELSQLVSDRIDKIDEETSVELNESTYDITPMIEQVANDFNDNTLNHKHTRETVRIDGDPKYGHSNMMTLF